jgi:hypothetical protein
MSNDKLAQEALDQIMEQAQVFASAWSLVGGPFDSGSALDDANDAKDELRTMVRSLATLAAEAEKQAGPVASDKEDAERYRWLRKQDNDDFCFAVVKNPHFDVYGSPEELDAAIDAARAKEQP